MFVIVQKIKLTILYSLFKVKLDSHGVVHEIFIDEFEPRMSFLIVPILL